jgi:hypothetical protein
MNAKKFRITDFSKRTIYHSPQTPGYTCWAGIWNMPDGKTMISFTQATGPVKGRPKAPPEVRKRLIWPPGQGEGYEAYDMTGLDLANIHLVTSDSGKTWDFVAADHFTSCMNGVTNEPETALADGTILRGVWGYYLPYDDVPQTGFIQRSTDGTKTWGKPEVILDPKKYSFWPKRVRVLRDGRVIITGAIAEFPAGSKDREEYSQQARPVLLVSDNGGKTWEKPIDLLPQEHLHRPYPGEECDAAELENGDMLIVYRWAVYNGDVRHHEDRRQSVLKKTGKTWQAGPVRPAPFPHSGHPELLATREDAILHIASTGIHATTDAGETWQDLGEGTGYYPRSVQLPDGLILCVYHHGGDDGYGDRDQSIGLCSFRLAEQP